MNMMKKVMVINVEKEFNLEKSVCNHGFFMMLPNQWAPCSYSFRRPLRLADGCSSVMVSISSSTLDHQHLIIRAEKPASLSDSDRDLIRKQVVRMLRLTNKDEIDVRKFQEAHPQAASKGFGRLFRAPDLFEDIIKAILLCNTSWNRTLEMCQYLCELQAELHSGMHKDVLLAQDCNKSADTTVRPRTINEYFRSCKRSTSKINLRALGNFPSSKELAGLSEEFLKQRCNLGLRAKFIIEVANLVENGELNLGDLELELEESFDEASYDNNIRDKLMALKGVGPFATNNILMCMGDYRNIPIDTETIKHLCEVHDRKDARQVYDKFAPYQCLAYWYELVESYERKLGQKLSKLCPSNYHKVATSYLSSNTNKEKESTSTVTATKRKRSSSR
ncbi:uncharacterized protein LOC110685591 [Chenopodium quinoa]|uniref:uncharacterized protein LOC110685591 n=1 Tax=Chenopodium quinoa TaxID=63459 RepID=UPI000B7918D3|nr:uncharacterized protein LOC110685591 [Chenopodium quinoa]